MKLFHGTTADAAKNIVENGFCLTGIETVKQAARAHEGECFYGFDSYDSAEDFALNQGYDTQAVVQFEVDEDQIELDPEYNAEDGAYFIIGEATNIELVWSQQ